jgi:hypothetical protein
LRLISILPAAPRVSSAIPSIFFLLAALGIAGWASAQEEDLDSGSVNQFFAPATKVNYALDKWRYSGEFQIRLDEDYRALNLWYLEGTATNLTAKHLELSADLRFSVKPDITEFRPGVGFILKTTHPTWQLALQSKYQIDVPNEGTTGHGLREILFANFLVNDNLIPGLVGGGFYRWRGDFDDWEFWRAGGGVTYVFDPFHTLNVSYFFGWENSGLEWTRSGFLLVQFSINIRNDWKYVPAKIVSF